MSKTQALGRKSNTVPASNNSENIDMTSGSNYADKKSVLKVVCTSTQAGTLYAKIGDETDSISSLPHTFSESVAANTTLLIVLPMVPGCNAARVYLTNGSGGAANYTIHAGIEEA